MIDTHHPHCKKPQHSLGREIYKIQVDHSSSAVLFMALPLVPAERLQEGSKAHLESSEAVSLAGAAVYASLYCKAEE